MRPYTLLEYLYQLRLRCNYEDSAMFTDGPEMGGMSDEVRGVSSARAEPILIARIR